MRKYSLFLVAIIVMAFISCSEDPVVNLQDQNDPEKKVYSELSDEQHKENLIANAEDLKNDLNQLEDEEAISIMEMLASLFESEQSNDPVMFISTPLNSLKAASYGDAREALSILNATETWQEDEDFDGDFDALFKEFAGTYDWNPAIDDFDKTNSPTDAIVFNFPGKDTDNANTASITINNFTVTAITETHKALEGEEMPVNLPSSIDVILNYTGTELIKWEFRASFQADAVPLMLKSELTVGDFMFGSYFDHSAYSKMSHRESLQFKNEIIIETYQEANGNWTEENIDLVVDEEGENFQEILQNANAYIQVMNIKLIGIVNFKGLADDGFVENSEMSTKAEAEAMVDIINKNIALGLIYADTETKIASAEAYPVQVQDEWDSWWQPGVYLVFSDGSKVDIEDYFNSDEFNNIINEYDTWLSDLDK